MSVGRHLFTVNVNDLIKVNIATYLEIYLFASIFYFSRFDWSKIKLRLLYRDSKITREGKESISFENKRR